MKEFDLDYVKQHWDEAQEYGLIQTRHGEDVKLTSLDLSSERSISGIAIFQGEEVAVTWRMDGHYSPIHSEDPNDLVIRDETMENLVIMNYVTGDIDIYKVSPDVDIDEDYISQKLGIRPSDCHWMFCQNGVNVEYHEEVLE